MSERWTDETEKRVRLAISDPGAFLARGDNYEESIPSWGARAALTALADAGLLVQPGGETREEWAYPVERDGVTVWIPTWIRDHRHLGGEIWVHRRTVTVWPDGTELLTPWWREVVSDAS